MFFFSDTSHTSRTTTPLLVIALTLLLFFPIHSFAFINTVSHWILILAENIVAVAQYVFLLTIRETVFEFGKFWGDGVAGVTLQSVWQIIRDIVNLLIVVLFVIVTMMTVFGEFVYKRKVLIGLILAAILVNFSAFFTLFIIDISNILFVMFFNILNIGEMGSLFPFSNISADGMIVNNTIWNSLLSVIIFVTGFFMFAGILYFCIILIERFIISLILVIGSPILTIGFFLKTFEASGSLTQPFVTAYERGRERMLYIFSTPIIILFGLFVIITIFDSILGAGFTPRRAGDALQNPSEALPQFTQAVIACIILIYGIFKIGSIAQNANITGKDGFKLFGKEIKMGQFLKNRADRLADPRRTPRGLLINAIGQGANFFKSGSGNNVINRLGRFPLTRPFVGRNKPFHDPANEAGRIARQTRRFGEAVETGTKLWRNTEVPFEDLRNFEAAYRKFHTIKKGARNDWSQRKQRTYRNLRKELEEIMNDPEKKASSMTKFFVEDRLAQMNRYIPEDSGSGDSENTRSGRNSDEGTSPGNSGGGDSRGGDTGGDAPTSPRNTGENGGGGRGDGSHRGNTGGGGGGDRSRGSGDDGLSEEQKKRRRTNRRRASKSPYKFLGISPGASDGEIQRRYERTREWYERVNDDEGVRNAETAFNAIDRMRNREGRENADEGSGTS